MYKCTSEPSGPANDGGKPKVSRGRQPFLFARVRPKTGPGLRYRIHPWHVYAAVPVCVVDGRKGRGTSSQKTARSKTLRSLLLPPPLSTPSHPPFSPPPSSPHSFCKYTHACLSNLWVDVRHAARPRQILCQAGRLRWLALKCVDGGGHGVPEGSPTRYTRRHACRLAARLPREHRLGPPARTAFFCPPLHPALGSPWQSALSNPVCRATMLSPASCMYQQLPGSRSASSLRSPLSVPPCPAWPYATCYNVPPCSMYPWCRIRYNSSLPDVSSRLPLPPSLSPSLRTPSPEPRRFLPTKSLSLP